MFFVSVISELWNNNESSIFASLGYHKSPYHALTLHLVVYFGFKWLTFARCDNAVKPLRFKHSQFESPEIYLSEVDALLLFFFYPDLTLSSVRHRSLLMFDSSFISLMLPLSLILTLFCHFFASSSFFFLASSSWEILEVSSASSVACTHTHTRAHK